MVKTLSDAEVKEVLAVDIENIELKQLHKWFADYKDHKRRFNTYDEFTLPANKAGNKESIKTSIGRYIFNGFCLAKLHKFIDYINEPITGEFIEKLNNRIGKLLLEDKIDGQTFKDYFNRHQWLGFSTVCFLAPSINLEEIVCPPKTAKLRKELFAKYDKEIKECNPIVVGDIQKQLLKSAVEEMKGTDIMEFYNSEAKGKLGNHYMNTTLMRGLIQKIDEQGFYVSKDNLVDGSSAEDQYKYCNVLLNGAIGRGVDTAKAGYLSKQFNSAFQGADIDKEGSDCGTKMTLKVKINKWNRDKHLYSYIVENGKLVLLDNETIDKYMDKTVNKRSPMYCKGEKICEKCFGKTPYMLGIKKIGLIISQMEEAMKNLSMKKFHDQSVKFNTFDISSYIKEMN